MTEKEIWDNVYINKSTCGVGVKIFNYSQLVSGLLSISILLD